MSRSVDDLIKIAASGAAIVLDGQALSTDDLVKIAGVIEESESSLTVRNVDGKTTDDLIKIAEAYHNGVIFEF